MIVSSWYRLTAGGKPASHLKALLRLAGCAVDTENDPSYSDGPLPRGARLAVENLPGLQACVSSLGQGGRLVVPSFGHFGAMRVWLWVAAEAARRGANLVDLETGVTLDFAADPGAGLAGAQLVEEWAGKMRTAKAREARIVGGRLGGPKEKLAGTRLHEARKAWGEDDGRSVPEIAAQFRVSEATLRRKMTDSGHKGGHEVGRVEAIALHRLGRWLIPNN
ncbi:MAG: hypothetical protein HQL38_01525 [Alphaproteobacteria bacterium]|nr:hypothetical protein [Alphaproteobacteria bacterium]